MRSKPSSLKVYVAIILAIMSLSTLTYLYFRGRAINSGYQFNGIVAAVRYDIKGIPYVSVSNKEYYLSLQLDFDHQIARGDSIVKKKGEMVVTLYKQDSGAVFVFGHSR